MSPQRGITATYDDKFATFELGNRLQLVTNFLVEFLCFSQGQAPGVGQDVKCRRFAIEFLFQCFDSPCCEAGMP